MNCGFLKYRLVATVIGVMPGVLMSVSAQEQRSQHDSPMEVSKPGNIVVMTNLSRLNPRNRTLGNLEADFKQPFKLFTSGESIDGSMAPPIQQSPPSVIGNKRVKELLDKQNEQKYWAFTASEDDAPQLSVEAILKIPEYDADGLEKKKQTPLEKYLDRQTRRRGGITNQTKGDDLFGKKIDLDGPSSAEVGNPFIARPNESERTLKRLPNDFNSSTIRGPAPSRSLSEIFGFGGTDTPEKIAARIRAQQERLNGYKQLLDSREPLSPNAGSPALNPFADLSPAPGRSAVHSSFDTPPSGSPDTWNSFATMVGTSLQPGGLPQATTSAGLPSLTPALPAAARPHMGLTPPPTFSIPKRDF